MTPLHERSLAEVSRLLAAGEVTPVELTRVALERVEALNGRLNAFMTVLAEQALAEAEALARQPRRGPLHGVPIALKDNIDTAGTRTTAGARIFADHVPDADATVTERLRGAGAINLGKLHMHELAGGTGHPDHGEVCNPWNPERSCGGSSSGSGAAVAGRLVWGALGTDTAGSIRLPAATTGIVGLKPTHGLVPRIGVVPLSPNLDHVGPMARTAEDCALLLQAVAGHDPRDPSSVAAPVPDYAAALDGGVDGMRVGVRRGRFEGERVARAVRAAFEDALETLAGLGADIVEVDAPDPMEALLPALTILEVELADFVRAEIAERPHDLSEMIYRMIRVGQFVPATDYVRCQRERARQRAEYERVLAAVDVLATPTIPFTAWPHLAKTVLVEGDDLPYLPHLGRFTPPYNLTGQPAVSVPCGFDPDGLPVGLQLAGRALEDATVLRAAHAYQQATDWHLRTPPFA